ncbi:MAG: riboflavin synthase [Bdellovibrionota bacterium]
MFTGLVERTGHVIALLKPDHKENKITKLIVDPGARPYKVKLGDSVSVNGCCLTVTSNDFNMLNFDVSSETLDKTTLSLLQENDLVNLERAMALGDRLGGHMVSGHVDVVGHVKQLKKDSNGWFLTVKLPLNVRKYVIEKGSICLDGVSLTINKAIDLEDSCVIELMLIPKTVETTSFSSLGLGQPLNIEVDLVGKYIERLVPDHLRGQ